MAAGACTPSHTRADSESASAARLPATPSATSTAPPAAKPKLAKPKVIICVWDGLRPDSISAEVTPNLARLRDHEGVNFSDHHAVYPTFTMMNAAALATGAYPGQHGFYGNTEYQPGPVGQNADGKAIDFSQPVFTEDHGVLSALDEFYRARGGRGLFSVDTLFEVAHAAGLRTAAIGKIGPAFLQDLRPNEALSVVLDENIALPFAFAQKFQAAGFALPANAARYQYSAGQTLTLAESNGKPTAALAERQIRLADGATPDPRASAGSAHNAANGYLMGAFLEYVLPKFEPDLSIIWLRNPDSTEHQFGPGSPNYQDALRDQDALLGKLQAKLEALGLRDGTDLIVVSDHGHSTVAGDPAIFPLRALNGEADGHGSVGALDVQGYAGLGRNSQRRRADARGSQTRLRRWWLFARSRADWDPQRRLARLPNARRPERDLFGLARGHADRQEAGGHGAVFVAALSSARARPERRHRDRGQRRLRVLLRPGSLPENRRGAGARTCRNEEPMARSSCAAFTQEFPALCRSLRSMPKVSKTRRPRPI